MDKTQTIYVPRSQKAEPDGARPTAATSGCGIDYTDIDIDLLDEVMDTLNFCAIALECDEQTRWNRRADNGLLLVMFSALEKLEGIRDVIRDVYEATCR